MLNRLRTEKADSAPRERVPLLSETHAALLVGGMGTRLRSVISGKPKPLAPVGDSTFLGLLVRHLGAQGIRRIVMCTGYLADQIESHFGDGQGYGAEIRYSKESEPLGTAGALKLAEPFLRGASDFLVLNGDTFLDVDFEQLLGFHGKHGGLVSIAARRADNAKRYGTLEVDTEHRVLSFTEKSGADAPGLINAGVYVFSQSILDSLPEGPASLERDVFPRLLDRGIYALEQPGIFIDIGTPEDYAFAQQLYAGMSRAVEAHKCEKGRA
jgi:D-glycero-alpha-D-manno-heptose 1-phosphate guanylyltransferase